MSVTTHRSRRLVPVLSSGLLLLAMTVTSAAPIEAATGPYLVKNINPNGGSFPQQLTALGNLVLFTADDGVHDRELWRSDGTAAGTYMVKDITPTGEDVGSEWPGALTAIGGLVYFAANDSVHGQELWVTDGTAGGTRMIELHPGPNGSGPRGFTEYNGLVYFSAFTPATGYELWRTDGTQAGTELVKDIASGGAHSCPDYLTEFAGKLYFVKFAGCGDKGVLFRTNGTPEGTFAARTKSGGLLKGNFTFNSSKALWAVGSTLYIGRTQKELWRSGGTKATTQKLVDFGTRRIVDVNGTAFISWYGGAQLNPPSTLWRSNGTTAGTVPISYHDGESIAWPSFGNGYLMSVGDKLFFFNDGLSVSQGTSASTERVANVHPGDDFYLGEQMAVLNSVLYFDGRTVDAEFDATPPALWRSDGTTDGTYALTPTYSNGLVDHLTTVGQSIYFVNRINKGVELYRYVP